MKVKDIILLIFGFAFFILNSISFEIVFEDEDTYDTVLKYELTEDKRSYKVVGITKSSTDDIVIPEIYDGLPVTEIDDKKLLSRVELVFIE